MKRPARSLNALLSQTPGGGSSQQSGSVATQDDDEGIAIGERVSSGPGGTIFKLIDKSNDEQLGTIAVVGRQPATEGKHKLETGTVVIRDKEGHEIIVDPSGKISAGASMTPEQQIVLRNLADEARHKAGDLGPHKRQSLEQPHTRTPPHSAPEQ